MKYINSRKTDLKCKKTLIYYLDLSKLISYTGKWRKYYILYVFSNRKVTKKLQIIPDCI